MNHVHSDEPLANFRRRIDVAAGRADADLVLKNALYVNVFSHRVCRGDIALADGVIVGIGHYHSACEVDMADGGIVLPGLIDAHIHLESSLVTPAEFARAVLPHGTVAVVTDPHEIANVMGIDGISYMLQSTEGLPVAVYVMLPSCVPATPVDEAGAELNWGDIDPLYAHPRVRGLAEMMNFPGVVAGNEAVLKKLLAARCRNTAIDGHAPGLTGNELNAYLTAGIASDHECFSLEDALAKLERGQHIMIREGTAAHNLEELVSLLTPEYAAQCMLCCDDRHPSDLLERGHIDALLRQAVSLGADPVWAVQAATLNPARYFGLTGRGAIAPGYRADLTIVDNLTGFHVKKVYVGGVSMFDGSSVAPITAGPDAALVAKVLDTFHVSPFLADSWSAKRPLGVLGLVPGELITKDCGLASDIHVKEDILKLAVVERHKGTGHIGLGFLKGYGLNRGAVATSVAHDSHNIIAVGASDADLAAAVQRILALGGGIVVVEHGQVLAELPLPIAGIMSDRPLPEVNAALERAKSAAHDLGVSHGVDPFMTLSFLSLPVIPALRLTTRGVLDVARQAYL